MTDSLGSSSMTEFTTETFAAEHERIGAMVTELVAGYMRSLDAAPVCSGASPAELLALFDGPLPEEGADVEQLLQAIAGDVIPHTMNISSPRYFGLFNPAPLPIAVWVDALCSAINQNSAAWRQSPSASALEACVIRWLCGLIGHREGGFGTLTSGGSEANLIALKCARDAAAARASAHGLSGESGSLRVYASEQCHFSLVKAVDILGIGRINLRKIDTDDRFRIRVDALREAIEEDLTAGYQPCCLVGVAGATSTGAIDPLDELARTAEDYGLWYHVDAAYGGAMMFSPAHRGALRGIERADSVTLDPHKWMFVPFSCGAMLARDGVRVLRDAFDTTPEYLGDDSALDFFRYGQLGTRRANALKLWAALRRLGRNGYREIIERQLSLTRYLSSVLAGLDDFEVVGDVQTAVCCVRFMPGGVTGVHDDDLQDALQQRIERGGQAWLSTTVLHGRRALRINVNSVLTQREHIDELITLLRHEGRTVVAELRASRASWDAP
ncbi:pyridoxal-dependent decarboxylase [Nonomuraea sp. NPDC005650]|uniref:pyridoxal phosphate-dependent decarboxylase family protein n=1 Tax=Nonomuraea sp. NPDC005650 TaxID=3157045 RepID=UPI0033AACBAA